MDLLPPLLRLWPPPLLLPLLLVLVGFIHCQTDLECLSEFRLSVIDQSGYLSSWSANSSSSSSICNAVGVQCLHPSEAKIYSLSLRAAGLSGSFPRGLDKCSSLTGLDLSGNSFSGAIPADLCKSLPFLVRLDLSGNDFSGSIPGELSQCQYLNALDLQQNHLTGSVPGQLGVLPRLTELHLEGNQLSGEIPPILASRPAANFQFQDNAGLCGPPLSKSCGGGSKASAGIIAGTVVGGAVILLAITAVAFYLSRRPKTMRDDTTWAKKIKAPRSITVSMFEQFLVKIKLSDLMAATESFSRDNVIDAGSAATGVAYRATLRDGSVLAVKRLAPAPRASSSDAAQFQAEVEALGLVRHANLVPLLGYCVTGGERLLLYKHMTNGTLWSWLHDAHGTRDRLDWPARLKVALGASRGMAYLHHGCNPRILHRSLSTHTILLDDDFDARITDFGLARIVAPAGGHLNADVLTAGGTVGDPGHDAPEYRRVPITTAKGDVYSFGVVLLQLLTSQKPLDVTVGDFNGSLVEWVGALYASGRSGDAIDKSLSGGAADDGELLQALKIACGCVLYAPNDRPSMLEVFEQLRKIGERYDFTDEGDEIPIAAAASDETAATQQRSNGNGASL
ncbi:hypothetical protein SELMODRAFT_164132 [Selaginella moellendorffii]|uniref:Protein kinase domain-containing protein n=1 Tax=Selaginella moellendorffii TaxID=88036 RepID=D8QMR3_SELML|nr:probable inactive receptor kinase At1g27190 [Selaginella moellendorffii]EFJ37976.1 hypothetical protein SELMODRAFT_164132 [Selaginella moellendorffii]|eukprot:XP_002960437.1 probable inactive receptor kinase At1g27190 [Selaginella moellendorffii]